MQSKKISRILNSTKEMWEPSKKTEIFLGRIFLKIELVEMREIENWLSEILLNWMLWNLQISKKRFFWRGLFSNLWEGRLLWKFWRIISREILMRQPNEWDHLSNEIFHFHMLYGLERVKFFLWKQRPQGDFFLQSEEISRATFFKRENQKFFQVRFW